MLANVNVHDRYYATTESVKDLLTSRESLKSVVEAWWQEKGIPIPPGLLANKRSKPRGFFARQVPTFRYEDAVFVVLSERAGLNPVWLGYEGDRMVSVSPLKRSYCKPLFAVRVGKRGGVELRERNSVTISQWDGRPLRDIKGDGDEGVSLVEFHRSQLLTFYPRMETYDFTELSRTLGSSPERYYPALLSLAIAHGVLFEDFHGGESGGNLPGFTERVFEPAFEEVQQRFGVKPLIIPMPWWPSLARYPSPEVNAVMNWRVHSFAIGEYATSISPS
ncbi:MAG: hypothetical protein KBD16_02760 [Candidatus Pacebacteria bacterium]|nr:hypothetical protein [Candidatus Paceibacterota bacterium]